MAHPAGIQSQDFFFHPVRIPAVLADNLGFKRPVPVQRHPDIYLVQLRLYPFSGIAIAVVWRGIRPLRILQRSCLSSSSNSTSMTAWITSRNISFIAVMISAVLVKRSLSTYSFSNSYGAVFIFFDPFLIWYLFLFLTELKLLISSYFVVCTAFYGVFFGLSPKKCPKYSRQFIWTVVPKKIHPRIRYGATAFLLLVHYFTPVKYSPLLAGIIT